MPSVEKKETEGKIHFCQFTVFKRYRLFYRNEGPSPDCLPFVFPSIFAEIQPQLMSHGYGIAHPHSPPFQ